VAALGGSRVKKRLSAVDSPRMVSIWTTIPRIYGSLFAVREGTGPDFPFLRNREDFRICEVLRHLADREPSAKVDDEPLISWEYYPGTPPKLRKEDGGFFVPGAMGKWTIRTSLGILKLYDQREVRGVPVVSSEVL